MKLMKPFAASLREAMGEMTQDALAAKSGVKQASISRYLRGIEQPRLPQLEALERALPCLRDIRHAA